MINSKQKLQYFFMKSAIDLAQLSHCMSVKVGAIIVKDSRIISMGYNGTPSGFVNCDQYFSDKSWMTQDNLWREHHHRWSDIHEIHAEMNAILFAAKNGISIEGATIYTSIFPCQHCLKNILQSGINRIVYNKMYDLGQYNKDFMTYIETVLNIERLEFARQPAVNGEK